MPEQHRISIVIPIYNEAQNVSELIAQLERVLVAQPHEIIFVNDGSTDDSWAILEVLAKRNPHIVLIDFARNFGKEVATSAGLQYASGQAVIVMDGDLEHPVELIPELIAKWRSGFDVVYTVRRYATHTPLFKKLTSKLYYYLINKISATRLEPSATDYRLLDRKVVDVFNTFTEHARFFRGLVDWLGFNKAKIEFTSNYQHKDVASYSLKKLWYLAVSGVISFSLTPLKVAGYLGTFITTTSGIFLVVMLVTRWFYHPTFYSPISFVIMFNILLSGIMLMCLGFIALYIGNIHGEVLNRPLFVVRRTINYTPTNE